MPTPRVTIGLPVYNGEKYLRYAVESVLSQDYQDFELVIVDNASTDMTAEICREYAAADPRVRYFRSNINIGAVPNFNRVFALTRGEFFKWLAHDDICYPGFIRKCVEVLDNSASSVSLVYPLGEIIDEDGRVCGEFVENVETRASRPHQRLRRILFGRCSALALCGLIRSCQLRKTRLRGSYVMDDMGLLAELAMIGECLKLNEVLLKIRLYAGNANKANATTHTHLVWLDPANRKKALVLNPNIQLFIESLRSVMYLRMGTLEKVLCLATVPSTYAERPLRNFAGRWRRRLFPSLKWGESERL